MLRKDETAVDTRASVPGDGALIPQPDLVIAINSPVAGEEVEFTTVVAGTITEVFGNPLFPAFEVQNVHVRFGEGGEVLPAQLRMVPPVSWSYSCSGPLPSGPGGQLVKLTVLVSGQLHGAAGTGPFEMSASVNVRLRQPFVPGAVDRVFAPTSYLDELMSLANRYVSVNGASPGPTPQALAARLFQPLDRLTQPDLYGPATAPVAQARIAVEVLRGVIGRPAPAGFAELDQRHRGAAYATLLGELGTTYAELRAARSASPEIRQSLADQLGVELSGVRPDLLDELTIVPEQVTDAQLEKLFGYRSTAPADPLQVPTTTPTVLLSRQDALRSRWRRDDEVDRDGPDTPLPVIDPDLIGERYLRSTAASDPARTLWTQRRDFIASKLAGINNRIAAVGKTLAGLDVVVTEFVGAVDLARLATLDAEGDDIAADLAPFNLSLDAFRYLAGVRAALAAGTPIDSEWQDVAAILVQVSKVRAFAQWRLEERNQGIVLQPATFVLEAPGTDDLPLPWRADLSALTAWRATLEARMHQSDTVESRFRAAVESAERQALPELRDALVAEIGRRRNPPESFDQAAERLSRELCIDLRAAGGQTDRVAQAIDSLQSLLVAVRSGVFAGQSGGQSLSISDEVSFDVEWEWLVSLPRWRSAMHAYAYPENQLLPNLYRTEVVDSSLKLTPTAAYRNFIAGLAQVSRLSPQEARTRAAAFLAALRTEVVIPPSLVLTDQRSSADIKAHRDLCTSLVAAAGTPGNPITLEAQIPQPIREVFWLVPVALARKLHESREFLTALDWYQTVFAYQWPQEQRAIYRGLVLEGNIVSNYNRFPGWLAQSKELNPHFTARRRKGAYTRFTVMSIVECLLAYADSEFARNAPDANARARALYQGAVDVLGLPEAAMPTVPPVPFPVNPVSTSLRAAADAGLAKIHAGLNIGGFAEPPAADDTDSFLPSPYRYATLVERAKNLVTIAQQVEASYFAALERTDAENYGLLQASHDLRVAEATMGIQDLKVAGAEIGVQLATDQRHKSQELATVLTTRINRGLNVWERTQVESMNTARVQQQSAQFYGVLGSLFAVPAGIATNTPVNPLELMSKYYAAKGEAASLDARIAEMHAGFARRREDWLLQKSQALRDVQIGDQQILLSVNQHSRAVQERTIAELNRDHAGAVAEFLATKFTNADLHAWMSGVLGRVYAYFLQQATALARLAEAQLAFERQEPVVGFIVADYWQEPTATGTTDPTEPVPNRRGLTGSARLLQDIHRLDEHAFATNRRKLQLAQTFSLSQLAGHELQQFRETGMLTFATPEELFDREFPGHHLRLIKSVNVSLVALLPPVRGLRATLSASGVSRTVVARGPFETVTLRREPESIAITSPINATGVLDLEPDNGMLRPFEGMGVDAMWQLELPKAANPFDYNTIADVLFAIQYTALDSPGYRQKVVRRLDRRFTGDRSFSVRNDFPDAWYDLNNPGTVEDPARRMRAILPLTAEDFPPHIAGLTVAHLTLFAVREDGFTDELSVLATLRPTAGRTIAAEPVVTVRGVVGTRRPGGAPWQVFVGADPAGEWNLQFNDEPEVRSWFTDGLIHDLVLVFSLSGTTPEWP